jgi:hypothetical protein
LHGCLGVEPRRVGIPLADGLCDLEGGGENHSGEDLHDWVRRAVPVLNYTLLFALQLKKNTENLSQGSRIVRNHSCVDLAAFLGAASTSMLSISARLPVGDFSQPLVGTSAFQVAEQGGSPHQRTFELKLSVSALMWSAKGGIPKYS